MVKEKRSGRKPRYRKKFLNLDVTEARIVIRYGLNPILARHQGLNQKSS